MRSYFLQSTFALERNLAPPLIHRYLISYPCFIWRITLAMKGAGLFLIAGCLRGFGTLAGGCTATTAASLFGQFSNDEDVLSSWLSSLSSLSSALILFLLILIMATSSLEAVCDITLRIWRDGWAKFLDSSFLSLSDLFTTLSNVWITMSCHFSCRRWAASATRPSNAHRSLIGRAISVNTRWFAVSSSFDSLRR